MGSSDMKKLGSKVIAFSVVGKDQPAKVEKVASRMHEGVVRPEILEGKTYKIKPLTLDAAIYLTINNIVLEDGQVKPYEVFINSKDTSALQWMIAVTRLLSAVFRKGGDITFVIEELRSVFDPKGGYFGPGGVWQASVVAEIGAVVEAHLVSLGLLNAKKVIPAEELKNAQVCGKCHEKALVVSDGCLTCLSCGNSKCG